MFSKIKIGWTYSTQKNDFSVHFLTSNVHTNGGDGVGFCLCTEAVRGYWLINSIKGRSTKFCWSFNPFFWYRLIYRIAYEVLSYFFGSSYILCLCSKKKYLFWINKIYTLKFNIKREQSVFICYLLSLLFELTMMCYNYTYCFSYGW